MCVDLMTASPSRSPAHFCLCCCHCCSCICCSGHAPEPCPPSNPLSRARKASSNTPASSLSCCSSVSARAMIASPSRSPAPFCGQPLMRFDPSMGTNLSTTWPDLNASPYVPSPILTTWGTAAQNKGKGGPGLGVLTGAACSRGRCERSYHRCPHHSLQPGEGQCRECGWAAGRASRFRWQEFLGGRWQAVRIGSARAVEGWWKGGGRRGASPVQQAPSRGKGLGTWPPNSQTA